MATEGVSGVAGAAPLEPAASSELTTGLSNVGQEAALAVQNGTVNESTGVANKVMAGLSTASTVASLAQIPMQAAQAKEAGRRQEAAAYRQATLTELDRTEKLKAKAAMKENAFNKQQSAWAQTSLLKLDQKEATSLGLMEGSGRVRNQNNLKSGFKGTQL